MAIKYQFCSTSFNVNPKERWEKIISLFCKYILLNIYFSVLLIILYLIRKENRINSLLFLQIWLFLNFLVITLIIIFLKSVNIIDHRYFFLITSNPFSPRCFNSSLRGINSLILVIKST